MATQNRFLMTYQRHRYAVLFYSLLSSIVFLPVLTELTVQPRFIAIFFAISILTAIVPIHSRRLRRILLIVVAIAMLEHVVPLFFSEMQLLYYSMGALSVVALLAAFHALRSSLQATKISSEQIYAALGAYLLAGVFIGNLYFILEKIHPGSLMMGGQVPTDFRISHGVYFSFVTLATLGYGDIVPHSEITRGVAIVEAVTGQFYLAVMVARLVSLHVAHKSHQ